MFGILVFGDSISFGRGESPSIGWSGRLKNYFEVQEFHNCLYELGIPGDTTISLLQRFEIEIKSRINYIRQGDKFIVMIAIGINDSRGLGSPNNLEIPPRKFESNISKLIQIAKKYTKDIVIIGLTPVDETLTNPFENTYFTNNRIKEYDMLLKKTSLNNKIYYINLFNPISKLNYKKLLADGVHPNKKGYQEIYTIIKEDLIRKKLIT
jgi:lysophospholipase L1-like esterase